MFNVILLCLLTCYSSFMPLKQSESIIIEDHAQVVEEKTIQNYYRPSANKYYLSYWYLASEEFNSYLFHHIADTWQDRSAYFNFSVWDNSLPTNQTFTFTTNDTGANSSYGQLAWQYQTGNFRPVYEYPSTTDTWKNDIYKLTITYYKTSNYFHEYVFKWYSYNYNTSEYVQEFNYEVGIMNPRNDQTTYNSFGGYSFTVFNYNVSTYRFRYLMCYEGDDLLYPTMQNIISGQEYNQEEYANGYNEGYNIGYNAGDSAGYDTGYDVGYSAGDTAGYTRGYNTGVSDTLASGSEAMTIFAGIMDVAFIPVNVFFLMFNYEVFGINIAGFVSGLLTIAIVIILMRFIFGRKV